MSGAASASTTMWPMLLDYSRDESKRILRRLELEAYSSIMSAFRAQGDLNKDKKNILQELQNALSISLERHRAEVRRAVNDERLTTIAHNMSGPNVSSEWLIEGRRLIPLMPRLVPQTAFTVAANNFATMQAEKNLTMPSPNKTGAKSSAASSSSPASATAKVTRPNSPSSNVVVLPSGMSIHIKGGLNTEEEDIQGKKRRRSSSIERAIVSRSSTLPTSVSGSTAGATKLTYTTTAGNTIHGISPMKIIFTKSPVKSHNTVTPSHSSQKVILMSNASQTTASSILQKSVSGPIVGKGNTTSSTTTTTTSLTQTKPSVIVPCTTAASSSNVTASAAVTSNVQSVSRAAVASGNVSVSPSTPVMPSTLQLAKPRPKTVAQPKTTVINQSRPGIVIPMGRQTVHGSPQTLQNVQIKPVTSKPTIHIKQEGSMKIITQGLPSSKILHTQSGGSPIVVVTTGASTSVTMVKSGTTISGSHIAGKVLNITSQAGKVITGTGGRPIIAGRPTTANVVTVNPKTLQLTAVKTVTGTPVTTARLATQAGVKPNVIVVQKAHGKHPQTSTATTTIHVSKTSAASSSPFEKELVSFIQKQDSSKQIITTQLRPGDRKNLIQKGILDAKKPQQIQIVRQRSEPATSGRSSLLAELIQAAGIMPESSSGSTSGQESPVTQEDTVPVRVEAPAISRADSLPVNQWVEYDVTDDMSVPYAVTSETTDTSAIKALLDLQSISTASKSTDTVLVSSSSSSTSKQLNLEQLSRQLQSATSTVYTIGQSDVLTSGKIAEQVVDSDVQFIPEDSVHLQKSVQIESPQIAGEEIEVEEVSDVTVVTSAGQPGTSALTQDIVELDPQTGMFIASSAESVAAAVHSKSQFSTPPPVTTLATSTDNVQIKNTALLVEDEAAMTPAVLPETSSGKSLDIFSSAIAEAQIDLDSYQFMEEENLLTQTAVSAATVGHSVSLSDTTQGSVSVDTQEIFISASEKEQIVTPGGSTSSQHTTVTMATEDKTCTPEVSTEEYRVVPNPVVPTEARPQNTAVIKESLLREVNLPASAPQTVVMTTIPGHHGHMIRQPQVLLTRCSNAAVAVETSGLDIGHMTMDDFTSQRLQERTECLTDVQIDELQVVSSPGGSGSDVDANLLRLSKRKRKPPAASDDSPPQHSMAGWTRAALGLLHRVSRYRGTNKDKGDMNAASWFTQPVNPEEVPDYYKIIQTPMDFGTMRKKLENGQYRDWTDFEDDMTLVRDNCYKYNPPGHEVRRDCDEVFSYYRQEYEKIQEKWQKTHSYSPAAKKIKFDRSPTKT